MRTSILQKLIAVMLLVPLFFGCLTLTSASTTTTASADTSAPIKKLTINGNDISGYTIVYPSLETEQALRPYLDVTFEDSAWGKNKMNLGDTLAEQFQSLMKQFTGYELPMVTDDVNKASDPNKVIVFRFNADMERSEFKTTIKGSVVTIEGGVETALWYGMYDFLETYLGVRFFSEDFIYAPETASLNLTNDSYTEKEFFTYRNIAGYYSSSETIQNNLARKLNSGTSEKYLMNRTQYGSTVGTTWYNAHSFEYQIPSGLPGSTWNTQPCLSQEKTFEYVRDAVLDLIAQRVSYGFTLGKTITTITVGWNDNRNYCYCSDCVAARTGEHNLSDQYINFVNRVADVVAEKYPEMKVMALAYDETREPPKTAVPRDNVVVMYCTAGCSNHSLAEADKCTEQGVNYPYGESNRRIDKEYLLKWLDISETVWVWEYVDAFGSFIGEAPFYSYIKDEIKWLAEHGVKGVYSEGRSNKDRQYCFEGLRDYLISELLWDPYMTDTEFKQLTMEYLEAYYGKEAAPYMYEYMLLWDESGNHENCWLNNYLGIKASIDLNFYGDNYDKMTQLFDKAEAVATGDQLTRIKKLRCSMEFLGLSGIYYDKYVNGSDSDKAWYKNKSSELYSNLLAYNLNPLDDYTYLTGNFETNSTYTSYESNAEKGTVLDYCPMTWYKSRDGFLDIDPFYYTAEFHTNGGTAVKSQKITNFFIGQPEETTREGYKFVGWYHDPEFKGEAHIFGYHNTIECRIGQGDCDENGVYHLYAKWELDTSSLSPLTITSHPAAVNAKVGTDAVFTVAVSGGLSPYTYQWQKLVDNTWTNISDTRASGESQMTVTGITKDDDRTQYRCIITDALDNTVTSNAAMLTIASEEALVITSQPSSASVDTGDDVTFSIAVSGGKTPYTYQWQKLKDGNWTNVKDATSAQWTLKSVTKDNSGAQYRCVVTDAEKTSVTSVTVTISVQAPLPTTGDESQPILWAMMVMLAGAALIMMKHRQDA